MMRPNSKLCNEINMHNASEAYRERQREREADEAIKARI